MRAIRYEGINFALISHNKKQLNFFSNVLTNYAYEWNISTSTSGRP